MKRTRRFLSLLLTLALLCALTAPALAAPPEKDLDTPLWQLYGFDSYEEMVGFYTGYLDMTQEEVEADYAEDVAYILNFMETRPEETARFRENAYSYFEEQYDYFDSPEEYMTRWNETEEQFLLEMTVEQIMGVQAAEKAAVEWALLCAAEPERTAQFLAELDTWFAEEYPWYGSFEEFSQKFASTEVAYLYLFENWNWKYEYILEQEKAKQEFITSLGGVPGQINVMVNGKFVSFPDAAPEAVNGRTMVPFRAILEALGAEVEYSEAEGIRCTAGGVEYAFTVGSSTVNLRYVDYSGEGETPDMEGLVMDCAPYVKNDRTYIPVRFISEALGYTVCWDSGYNCAVIIDPDALAAEINKDFTILNGLFTSGTTLPERYKTGTALEGDVTVFNSLDGDQNVKFTLDMDTLTASNGTSGAIKYDLSELAQLMPGLEELEDSEEYKLILSLLAAEMKVLVDRESGTGYVNMPALNALYNLMGREIAKNAWLSAEYTQAEAQIPTIGDIIAANTLAGAANPFQSGAVFYYGNALGTAAQLAALFGDKNFTREDGAQVLTLDMDSLAALTDEDDYYGYSSIPKEFALTLTIRDGGAVEFALTWRGLDHDYTFGMVEYLISTQGKADGLNISVTAEVHVKNQLKAVITLTRTGTGTDQRPETTPPQGAPVVDLEELAGGGITAPDGPEE